MSSTKPPPPLNIPASSATVTISAIDTTTLMDANTAAFTWNPPIKGFDRAIAGSWSFLIEHHASGRKLLYDLGLRPDWEKLPPALGLKALVEKGVVNELKATKGVADILTEGGVKLEGIEAVIWSHWHFDHTGDMSTFPSSTRVIVGPGFRKGLLPGYPSDPEGVVMESDFHGREIDELDFTRPNAIQVGRFKALDYFGDGSFYILDAPGHAIGHVHALARTHASPDATFVHLAADSIHHVGQIRPSEYLPLPDPIVPSPVPKVHPLSCPGHFFSAILRDGSREKPILEGQDPFKEMDPDSKLSLIYDEPALRDTIQKDEEFDAHEAVFTVIAHDWSLKGVIDEWPKPLNGWREAGWKEKGTWKFLEDFEAAGVHESG